MAIDEAQLRAALGAVADRGTEMLTARPGSPSRNEPNIAKLKAAMIEAGVDAIKANPDLARNAEGLQRAIIDSIVNNPTNNPRYTEVMNIVDRNTMPPILTRDTIVNAVRQDLQTSITENAGRLNAAVNGPAAGAQQNPPAPATGTTSPAANPAAAPTEPMPTLNEVKTILQDLKTKLVGKDVTQISAQDRQTIDRNLRRLNQFDSVPANRQALDAWLQTDEGKNAVTEVQWREINDKLVAGNFLPREAQQQVQSQGQDMGGGLMQLLAMLISAFMPALGNLGLDPSNFGMGQPQTGGQQPSAGQQPPAGQQRTTITPAGPVQPGGVNGRIAGQNGQPDTAVTVTQQQDGSYRAVNAQTGAAVANAQVSATMVQGQAPMQLQFDATGRGSVVQPTSTPNANAAGTGASR